MISNRRLFSTLALCLCVTASNALAGGGSKRDSTLEVVSEYDGNIGVLVNPSAAQISAAQAATTPQAFMNAGGKIIQADGSPLSYSVKAGTQKVFIVYLDTDPIEVEELDVEVGKGETATVTVTESGVAAPESGATSA